MQPSETKSIKQAFDLAGLHLPPPQSAVRMMEREV
jgi:hypothetical protein